MEQESIITTDRHGFSFSGVPVSHIDEMWPYVSPFVVDALNYGFGEWDEFNIYDFLMDSDMQLWVVIKGNLLKGVVITEVVRYPKKKVLRIALVSGSEIKNWKHYIDALESWGASINCTAIEGWGRKGWEKMVKDIGFTSSRVVLCKEIGRLH